MILGALIGFILHAVIEIVYINLLVANFARYSIGLDYPQLYVIHAVGTFLIVTCGICFGFWQGKYWWQKIYIERIREK